MRCCRSQKPAKSTASVFPLRPVATRRAPESTPRAQFGSIVHHDASLQDRNRFVLLKCDFKSIRSSKSMQIAIIPAEPRQRSSGWANAPSSHRRSSGAKHDALRKTKTMSEHDRHHSNHPQAIKRTTLQKSDVPGTNYETVFGIAEIAPNADFASHTHPGTESGYLMEGSLTHDVEGQPTREARAGDSVFIPAGVPHSGRAGPEGAKILSTWVVEKGKPLASPAEPLLPQHD